VGTFRVTIEIGDPHGERWETLEALVDTGATYTWVPWDILARLGVEPQSRREFLTADQRVIEREMAVAVARLDGQTLPTLVVFGDEGSLPLLGMVTLEEFGLGIDLVNRRLIRVRGLAMSTQKGPSGMFVPEGLFLPMSFLPFEAQHWGALKEAGRPEAEEADHRGQGQAKAGGDPQGAVRARGASG